MKDSRLTVLKTVFLLSSKRGRGQDSDKLRICKTVTGINRSLGRGELILETEGKPWQSSWGACKDHSRPQVISQHLVLQQLRDGQ